MISFLFYFYLYIIINFIVILLYIFKNNLCYSLNFFVYISIKKLYIIFIINLIYRKYYVKKLAQIERIQFYYF